MKLIFTILFLFISVWSISQNIEGIKEDTVFIKYDPNGFDSITEYSTDTFRFNSQNERHILIGTTVIPETKNQMSMWKYGLQLEDVKSSNCIKNKNQEFSEISIVENSEKELIIEVNIRDNCCYSFLCDAGIDSSGILNLTTIGYGGTCGCYCNFSLTFNFNKNHEMESPPINGIMLNGNKDNVMKTK